MQSKIAHFLRSYKDHKRECRKSFAAVIKKQIDQNRTEYNNLIRNLSTSAFAPDVVADISARMNEIKNEIETLENTEPPEEYTSDAIIKWLQAIREAPDKRAINLLIERIEVSTDKKTTDIKVTSTLTSVVNLAKDCYFNKMRVIVNSRNRDTLLLF